MQHSVQHSVRIFFMSFGRLYLEHVVRGGAFLGVSGSEHGFVIAGVEIRSLFHLFIALLYTRLDVVRDTLHGSLLHSNIETALCNYMNEGRHS